MSEDSAIYKRKIQRLQQALEAAETLLEEKSRELYNVNMGLEQTIIERTEELKSARDEAIAANKAKSRFVARMSHEIRTPLNGIIGLTDLLKNTPMNQQQTTFVETIEDSGEILLSIINDILEYSKIQAGKMTTDITSINVQDHIDMVARILYPQAHRKSVQLLVNIQKSAPLRIQSDSAKFKQVLLNIIGNAIKYTPSGEIEISAFSTRTNILSISVRDTGVGISPERVAHTFEAFTQADNSDTRKYGGTGLGLSICKTFIENLGGTIDVTSAEGIGSTFSFHIPSKEWTLPSPREASALEEVHCLSTNARFDQLIQERCNEMGISFHSHYEWESLHKVIQSRNPDTSRVLVDSEALPKKLELENSPSFYILCPPKEIPSWKKKSQSANVISQPLTHKGFEKFIEGRVFEKTSLSKATKVSSENDLKILLVEDNLINQTVAEQILKIAGFGVDIVNNGAEAVEAAKQVDYAIILMDFNMPVMDGPTATRNIRKLPNGKEPFIIGLTASALKETREECSASGMNDFLTKPVRADQLIDRIKRIQSTRD